MPYSSGSVVNLSANTKSANVMSGDINEFVSFPALVRIYNISSASGIRVSVNVDSDVVIDDKEINAIGTSLLRPDHLVDEFEIEAGSRITMTFRETAGASTTDILWGVEIVPID